MITPLNWEAHIEHDVVSNCDRLLLIARQNHNTVVLKSFDEDSGGSTLEMLAEGVAVDKESLPLFPPGALQAIAEAIKPGPPAQTVEILQEVLAHERKRVDAMLGVLYHSVTTALDSPD
jgi:hypothetical protein